MRNKKAFTLIELLVVIAIIAVLMAILMPALNRVREQGRAVKCRAHLRQWGLIFALYTGENDGKFYSGLMSNFNGNLGNGEWWRETMRPLSKDKAMWLCPTAAKNRSGTAVTASAPAQSPFDAWRVPSDQGGDEGSYTPNGWMCNPPRGMDTLWGRGPAKNYWRHVPERSASIVPVMSEGWWVDVWPRHTDQPAPYGDRMPPGIMSANDNEMQRVCVNRHKGSQNVLFADWSARKVSPKQLWRLKWHRYFDTNVHVIWPQWMERFKDEY